MPQKIRKEFDYLSDEKRAEALKNIIAFFQDERDEEIGLIAAEELLDFFLQTAGEEIYKKAIHDVKKLIKERMEDIEIEIDLLAQK